MNGKKRFFVEFFITSNCQDLNTKLGIFSLKKFDENTQNRISRQKKMKNRIVILFKACHCPVFTALPTN
jgi:hypothetical protein